jgi:hypothetical protein
MTRQARNRHRNEDETANDVGRDHHPAPVPAVGDDAAVQPEQERRHAVGQSDGDHPQWPARDEREPHQRDVLECVSELADGDGGVRAAEVSAAKEG